MLKVNENIGEHPYKKITIDGNSVIISYNDNGGFSNLDLNFIRIYFSNSSQSNVNMYLAIKKFNKFYDKVERINGILEKEKYVIKPGDGYLDLVLKMKNESVKLTFENLTNTLNLDILINGGI